VDFSYVQQVILAEASPVFEGMFSLHRHVPGPDRPAHPPDSQQYRNGLPVIPVTESSEALHNLLCYCYPVATPKIEIARTICEVLEAAKKYMMDSIVSDLVLLFASRAEKQPFQMYALAATRGWKEEMKIAARASLGHPLSADTYVPEMATMTVTAYVRLQQYHKSYRFSAQALRINSPTEVDASDIFMSMTCSILCTVGSSAINAAACAVTRARVSL